MALFTCVTAVCVCVDSVGLLHLPFPSRHNIPRRCSTCSTSFEPPHTPLDFCFLSWIGPCTPTVILRPAFSCWFLECANSGTHGSGENSVGVGSILRCDQRGSCLDELVLCLRLDSSDSRKDGEEAIRAMQQQFTAALDGLTRQNAYLQAELAHSRQQAANEMVALGQEVRAPQGQSPHHEPEMSGPASLGVNTWLLGMPSDFSGNQEARRDWCAVFKGCGSTSREARCATRGGRATAQLSNG